MNSVQRLLGFLRPYRGRLVIAVVAMAGLALATASYPLLLDLLATVLIQNDQSAVARALEPAARVLGYLGVHANVEAASAWLQTNLVLLFAVVVGVKATCQAVRFFVMGDIAQRVILDLRLKLFERLIAQSSGFFHKRSSGELMSRATHDVALVERATTYAIPVMLGDLLRVLALTVVCLFQYTELFFVAALVIPLAAIPIAIFGRLLRRYGKGSQEELAGISHRLSETLGGINVVKAFGGEEHELGRFTEANTSYAKVMLKSVLVRALQTPAMELVGVAALLGTLSYAVGEVQSGVLRPGEVVGFLLALVLLYEPAKALGRINGILMPGLAAADRVFEIIDQVPDIQDAANATPLSERPAQLALNNVSFRYAEDRPWAVRNLSFSIARGEAVALVGVSGSGKSTVASLIIRLFDPTEGEVQMDGVALTDLTIASVRQNVAVVAQDTFLFNDSVAANIAYGTEASLSDIKRAAERARATEFIEALPDGFDSIVGERGALLSGGQRQRLAIARAFLRDAPIIVLDEATSALDPENESDVQAALHDLCEDRVALIIAHDLTTVRLAREVIVMHEGQAIERGTHDELLQQGGWYGRWAKEVG